MPYPSFCFSNRPVVLYNFLRQTALHHGIVYSKQGPGVTERNFLCLNQFLDVSWQLQDAKVIRHEGTISPNASRDFILS